MGKHWKRLIRPGEEATACRACGTESVIRAENNRLACVRCGLMHDARPIMQVKVRGKVYPSARAAAAALGVKVMSVYCAISRGNLDRLGLGPDYSKKITKGGQRPRRIVVAGQEFPSIASLARALGRPRKSVGASLRAGETARRRIALGVMALVAQRENAAMRASTREDMGGRAA